MISYLYIAVTILCTVAGQLMLKHATNSLGHMPSTFTAGAIFLLRALTNIYIVAGFALAFVASLTWIAAVSKLELSYAYPFMSLNFVLVLVLSAMLFNEQVNAPRIIGMLAICIGVYLISRS